VLQWDSQQLKDAETTYTTFGQASAVAQSAGSTESPMDGHIKSPSPRLAGYINASRYLYAQFADPVNAVVNSIWVGLTPFYYTIPPFNPLQPSPYPAWTSAYLPTWLSATGWSEVSSNSSPSYQPLFFATLTANAVFKNSVFPLCLGGTVTATYINASVIGYYQGSVGASGSWTLVGPVSCIYLLTPSYRVVRTL